MFFVIGFGRFIGYWMHGESECVQLCSDISLGALLFGSFGWGNATNFQECLRYWFLMRHWSLF